MTVNTFDDVKIWPVKCKDGETRLATIHKANFKGKHNASKCKILIVLYSRRFNHHDKTGLTLEQLHVVSGVSLEYLRSRITKWFSWKYIAREPVVSPLTGRMCFSYTIAERGIHMLEDRAPRNKLEEWETEILNWQISTNLLRTGT